MLSKCKVLKGSNFVPRYDVPEDMIIVNEVGELVGTVK
jgi:hypothetical protein